MGKFFGTAFLAFLICAPVAAQAEGQRTFSFRGEALASGFAGEFLSAYSAERNGDWPAARQHLESLAMLDRDNPEMIHRLTLMQLEAGDFSAATQHAETLLKLDPSAHLAQLICFAGALRREDKVEAQALLSSMSSEGMGQYLKPFLSAWLSGSAREAIAALKPLSGTASLRSVYTLQLALLSDHFGVAENADILFLKAVAAHPAYHELDLALSHFLRRRQPERVEDLLTAAIHGDMDTELARALTKTIAKQSVVTAADGVAEVLYSLSLLLQAEGASDIALPYLQIALAFRPDFPEAQILVGDLLVREARYSEASTLFTQLLAHPVWGPQAVLRIGILQTVTGSADSAAQQLAPLAETHPEWPVVWQQLGDTRIAAGDAPGAVIAFTHALSLLSAQHNGQLRGRLLASRAYAYQMQQAFPELEADLTEAVQFLPQNAELLNHLGYLWAERGVRLSESADLISRALHLEPNNGNSLDSLGWVNFRMGNYSEAVRLLELASEILPYNPGVNDHLGDAYWAVGRQSEARFQWQRSLLYRESPTASVPTIDELRAKIERGPTIQLSAERHELQN